MFVVQVYIRVKADCIPAFLEASRENARHSIEEPGIERFELLQSMAEPSDFVLTEIYRSAADQARHKATAHFNQWHTQVEPMMAGPRSAVTYTHVFPQNQGQSARQ